ncbi:hypothetical protein GGS21DRAFT_150495 [Xylaria nigripes]|nr:hypothetical protein GGS21DRAFT_150495 [Xylaria nigripes]
MAKPTVLRFPISGQSDGSFLLEVSSNGSRPLDLKLIGSESTAVFLAKLRHKKIDECKASPAHCTDEEWQQILISILVDLKPEPDIEVKADVQPDLTSVALSFRKNIQGITQRLGTIKLDENDKTEISPFDWCVSAIASRTKAKEELVDVIAEIDSLKRSVSELKAQLDDFIITKEEDETQMLEKFRDLLNEKKLKIRQQQRLLSAAKVDPEKLATVSLSEENYTHRRPGLSRSAKRKALETNEDDESDDGFEKMDIDEKNVGDNTSTNNQLESDSDTDNHQPSTDNDMTETASDTDNDSPSQAKLKKRTEGSPPGRITKPKMSGSKQAAQSSRNLRAAKQKQTAVASDLEGDDNEDEAPPPPRHLPFTRSKQVEPPPKPADDDETQSDDDSEL